MSRGLVKRVCVVEQVQHARLVEGASGHLTVDVVVALAFAVVAITVAAHRCLRERALLSNMLSIVATFPSATSQGVGGCRPGRS